VKYLKHTDYGDLIGFLEKDQLHVNKFGYYAHPLLLKKIVRNSFMKSIDQPYKRLLQNISYRYMI
jgi:hypothetical protein